jgi:hypothetical protein
VTKSSEKEALHTEMILHHHSDSSVSLDLTVTSLSSGKGRGDVLCNIYLTEISRGGMMGSLMTDEKGKAQFPLVNKYRWAKDTIEEFLFICRIANDDRFVSLDDTALFRKANVEFEQVEEPGHRGILVRATELGEDEKSIPLNGLVVQQLIYRDDAFEDMEGKTELIQNNGQAFIGLNEDMEGDSNGFVSLKTQILSPSYGLFEKEFTVDWGSISVSQERSALGLVLLAVFGSVFSLCLGVYVVARVFNLT